MVPNMSPSDTKAKAPLPPKASTHMAGSCLQPTPPCGAAVQLERLPSDNQSASEAASVLLLISREG